MTAEELAAHVEAIGPVLAALADGAAEGLPLSDAEEEALGIADAAIRLGAFGAKVSGNEWAMAAAALVSAVPLGSLLRLIESWRQIRVRAMVAEVVVGPLGPGVVVEGRG